MATRRAVSLGWRTRREKMTGKFVSIPGFGVFVSKVGKFDPFVCDSSSSHVGGKQIRALTRARAAARRRRRRKFGSALRLCRPPRGPRPSSNWSATPSGSRVDLSRASTADSSPLASMTRGGPRCSGYIHIVTYALESFFSDKQRNQ